MVKKRPKSRPVRVSGATGTPRSSSASESLDEELYKVLSSTPSVHPILINVCRLCETKYGPFLNIFDAERVISKRIDEVLPFSITENDELPHKICFRCSAKVEELYEFILKCVSTENNLRTALGKKAPVTVKSKLRVEWERHLETKSISNDDICNAMIKKAMEGIKDLPLNPLPLEEEKLGKPLTVTPLSTLISKNLRNGVEPAWKKEKEEPVINNDSEAESEPEVQKEQVTLKQVKLAIEKCDSKMSSRSSRSSTINKQPETYLFTKAPEPVKTKTYPAKKQASKVQSSIGNTNELTKQSNATDSPNSIEKHKETPPKAPEAPPPPINIMDHVSTIKVNSVGTLYLCKLCNRNFLKKEVVLSHGCAKNNVPKDKFLHNMPPRDIPKPPVTVKYLKMDKDFKKTVENRTAALEKPAPETKAVEKKVDAIKFVVHPPQEVKQKPKPRVGPASKTKQLLQQTAVQQQAPQAQPPPVEEPVVPDTQFPQLPSLNSRYKLVPGLNNTFTLVEDSTQLQTAQFQIPQAPQFQMPQQQFQMAGPTSQFQMTSTPQYQMTGPVARFQMPVQANQFQMNTMRPHFQMQPQTSQYQLNAQTQQFQMQPMPVQISQSLSLATITQVGPKSKTKKRKHDQPVNTGQFGAIVPDNRPQDVIDLEESILPEPPAVEQPYPVGMFTTPQHSGALAPNNPKPLTTPAMKKQSYTIVQTGNPSKLLISTKRQPVAEDQQKKKSKKKTDTEENSQSKDPGYFTFINVDPVQPTYILPTDNIIQESQITTSTPVSKGVVEKEKDKYSCNMCEETFSREKKLLAHIQSHFNQMDEEDQLRKEKSGPSSKKRTRRS